MLDTDHASLFFYQNSEAGARFRDRLAASGEVMALGIVTGQELVEGRLLAIAQEPRVARQVPLYERLATVLGLIAQFLLLPFDQAAADRFATMGRTQVSVNDRKIAAVVIVNNAFLLTSNRRDFERIPGLNFADWSV